MTFPPLLDRVKTRGKIHSLYVERKYRTDKPDPLSYSYFEEILSLEEGNYHYWPSPILHISRDQKCYALTREFAAVADSDCIRMMHPSPNLFANGHGRGRF